MIWERFELENRNASHGKVHSVDVEGCDGIHQMGACSVQSTNHLYNIADLENVDMVSYR